MARHKSANPKVRKELVIDQRLFHEVELFLPRDYKGDLKYGAFADLVAELLSKWLSDKARTFPQPSA